MPLISGELDEVGTARTISALACENVQKNRDYSIVHSMLSWVDFPVSSAKVASKKRKIESATGGAKEHQHVAEEARVPVENEASGQGN